MVRTTAELPPGRRRARRPESESDRSQAGESASVERASSSLVKRAHPDLGRLGVFWHTQGSGKSYSMAFFAEKVRRACRATSRSWS